MMIHSGKWIFIRFNPDHTPTDIEDRIIQLLKRLRLTTVALIRIN
jgi:hypothetical protein